MRYGNGLIGVAILAAASASVPGEAAQGRIPWAKVGEWEVGAFKVGFCSADRVYPGGTRVSLSSHRSGYAGLSVLNRAWSMQTAGHYEISLVQGGARRSFAGEDDGYLHGLGRSAESGDALLAQLAAGGALEIAHPDGRLLERLDLGEVAPALAKLGTCLVEAATAANFPPVAAPPPPRPPRLKVQPARAQASLASLFSSDDYPAAALRAEEEGAVEFRIEVGKDGRVGACTITVSSGSPALDSTTCQLITMRARFRPARNSEGQPTGDSFSGRIVWRLPEPEPPPPPPSP
jgi:TonB family protein